MGIPGHQKKYHNTNDKCYTDQIDYSSSNWVIQGGSETMNHE